MQVPVEHKVPSLAAIIGVGAWMSDGPAGHGSAQLVCEGGCRCTTRTYHFTHPYPGLSRVRMRIAGSALRSVSCTPAERHVLQAYWKTVNATMLSPRSHCLLRVVNSPHTRSGGHRLEVQGLMMSEELQFVDTWDHWKLP